MKTLSITISDEAAEALDKATAGGAHTAEEVASHIVETSFADWGDLDGDDIAAIEAGVAELDRGEAIPHEQVVSELRTKHGW